jgi:hypothetical protein
MNEHQNGSFINRELIWFLLSKRTKKVLKSEFSGETLWLPIPIPALFAVE